MNAFTVKRFLLFVGVSVCACLKHIQGATDESDSEKSGFEKFKKYLDANFIIAESVTEKSSESNPVSLGLDPNGHLATDFGVKYTPTISNFNDQKLGLLFEYHKQNSSKSPEDSVLGGLDYTWMFISVSPDTISHLKQTGELPSITTQFVDANGIFKNDRLKTGRTLGGSIQYYWIDRHFRINGYDTHDLIPWYWGPSAYLEGEHSNGLKATDNTGTVARIHGSASVTVDPFAHIAAIGYQMELTVTEDAWLNFSRSGTYSSYNKNQSCLSTKLTTYFDHDKFIGLYVGYDNGENPVSGKNKSRSWSFGLAGSITHLKPH